jgi:hypothetical protein
MKKANLLRKPRLRRQDNVSRFPGPYVMNPVFRKKFRFQAQTNESKDADYVTMASLQNLMCLVTSGTTGYGFFSAVRLRAVEIWADSSSSNNLSTIGIDWLSPDAPNQQINATGNSFQPAHIRAVPPKNSAAGRWYAGQLLAQNTPTSIVSTSPYAFSIVTNISGTIVEIDLEFTMFDYDTLNNPFSCTLTGGQSGTVAYNSYLDNTSVSLGNGTKNLLILGVSNVTTSYISSW